MDSGKLQTVEKNFRVVRLHLLDYGKTTRKTILLHL
nr:MAG TPA: hypothetical protein [Caudoviricetes sp.]